MRTRSKTVLALTLAAIVALAPLGCRTPAGETKAEKRASVRKMRTEALADLYKDLPDARGLIDRSVGYAVFSSIGTHLMLLSTARGYGILKDKGTGKDTYMEMFSLGGGVGLGVKDYRAYMIFLNKDAMDQFREHGIDFGGQGVAAATTGEEGDEGFDFNAAANLDSVQAEVVVLQITEAGLALHATLQGTKFTPSEELN